MIGHGSGRRLSTLVGAEAGMESGDWVQAGSSFRRCLDWLLGFAGGLIEGPGCQRRFSRWGTDRREVHSIFDSLDPFVKSEWRPGLAFVRIIFCCTGLRRRTGGKLSRLYTGAWSCSPAAVAFAAPWEADAT